MDVYIRQTFAALVDVYIRRTFAALVDVYIRQIAALVDVYIRPRGLHMSDSEQQKRLQEEPNQDQGDVMWSEVRTGARPLGTQQKRGIRQCCFNIGPTSM